MKKLMAVCFAFVIITPLPAYASEVFLIDDGSVAKLREAIEVANANPMNLTTIYLTGDFHFTTQIPLPPINTRVLIESINNRARLLGPEEGEEQFEGPNSLFRVGPDGELTLRGLEITELSLKIDTEGLIQNQGSLTIHQVLISGVTGYGYCMNFGPCYYPGPLIHNHPSGDLELNNVSIVDSGVGGVSNLGGGVLSNYGGARIYSSQLYQTDKDWIWTAPFYNVGTIEVNSSTFFNRPESEVNLPRAFGSENPGDFTIENSIIAGFSGASCQQVTSRGFNLSDHAECEWASNGDITGVQSGLLWREVQADWFGVYPQILTYALVPTASSAAVDSANPETCSPFDLLGQRRSRIDLRCDRGAVEAQASGLSEGGINGLFFNPEADGHYLQILQTDYLTLVIWNTFDLDGNHVWVYGTGQLVDGRSLVAETYINYDAMVLPDAPVGDADTEYWGTLEIDMASCTKGTVAFDSVSPDFGSGQFPIERLAYVKQIGCID